MSPLGPTSAGSVTMTAFGSRDLNHLCAPSARLVAVEADIDAFHGFEVRCPFRKERGCARSGGYGQDAIRFEDKAVEFALADDHAVRFAKERLPTVQLHARADFGEHLRSIGSVIR